VKERQLDRLIIILIAFGICSAGYFLVILPYLNRGEGDPRFYFVEVPINVTTNTSVIHLTDKDILNVPGLEVRQENGKIYNIVFRVSETPPGMSIQDFRDKYGSSLSDPSSRKYLEYQGVYYYVYYAIP
jgi:hypothetical protein